MAPGAALLLAFVLIATRDNTPFGSVANSGLAIVLLLTFLGAARRACALRQNQHLVARLRTFKENEGRTVARCTRLLTSLPRFARSVNASRLVEHTRQAREADAVVQPADEGPLAGLQSHRVLDAMVTAIDNKDRYTRWHSEEVMKYALWIAEELRLPQATMWAIRVGGLLHDIGKIGVPNEILCKPGRLNAEEWEVMKRHPHLGALIVSGVPGLAAIIDAVRYHHERWDGRGYPEGLAGEASPLLGRILAVADAFSAMTTDRPYRKGMAWDVALGEIRANIGTQFDPTMAHAFLRAVQQRFPARPSIA